MLSVVGTAAMLWVGGGILIHGLEETGLPQIAHWLHDLAAAAGHAVPEWGVGAVEWLISASGAGVLGLVVGAALIPTSTHLLAPVLRAIQSKIRGKVRTENTPAPV
jgi:predicted DNA repair protein MutK